MAPLGPVVAAFLLAFIGGQWQRALASNNGPILASTIGRCEGVGNLTCEEIYEDSEVCPTYKGCSFSATYHEVTEDNLPLCDYFKRGPGTIGAECIRTSCDGVLPCSILSKSDCQATQNCTWNPALFSTAGYRRTAGWSFWLVLLMPACGALFGLSFFIISSRFRRRHGPSVQSIAASIDSSTAPKEEFNILMTSEAIVVVQPGGTLDLALEYEAELPEKAHDPPADECDPGPSAAGSSDTDDSDVEIGASHGNDIM